MQHPIRRARILIHFDSTKKTQCMGIGAYQIRETARSMGGDVAVSSNMDEGTVVSMTLRIADNQLDL